MNLFTQLEGAPLRTKIIYRLKSMHGHAAPARGQRPNLSSAVLQSTTVGGVVNDGFPLPVRSDCKLPVNENDQR